MGAVARIAGVTVRTLHHYDEMAQYLHDAIKANAARKGL
jgi:DNA-binding transcriptional MerR regulator